MNRFRAISLAISGIVLAGGLALSVPGSRADAPAPIVVAQANLNTPGGVSTPDGALALEPVPVDPLPTPAAVDVPAPAGMTAFSEAEVAEINAIIAAYIAANPGFIRDYLLTNPEVIREAVTELERRRIENEAAQQAQIIADNRDILFNSPRQAVLGNPDGDVTLVEFFDYNCTYCRQALQDVNRLVAEDPNLRVVLKEFPVLGPGSVEAAQVAAALNLVNPELYWDFHFLLLGSGVAASTEAALVAAEQVGADRPAIEGMLEDDAVLAAIEESYTVANALGLTGTPTFVIGDEVVVGAVGYDQLLARITAMRECGATMCL